MVTLEYKGDKYVYFYIQWTLEYLLKGVNYDVHYMPSHFLSLWVVGWEFREKIIEKASSSFVMCLLPQISDRVCII